MKFNKIEYITRLDLGNDDMMMMVVNRYHNAITKFYEWSGEKATKLIIDRDIRVFVVVGPDELIKDEFDNWNNWNATILPSTGLDEMFSTRILARGKNHLVIKTERRERQGDYKL